MEVREPLSRLVEEKPHLALASMEVVLKIPLARELGHEEQRLPT